MNYATDKWFRYLREDVLTEGIRDIGLPEVVIDRIEATLPDATEKAKTWMGHQWKDTRLHSIPVRGQERGTTAQEFGHKLLNILSAYTDEQAWEGSPEPGEEPKGSELSPEAKRKRILYIIQDMAYSEGVVVTKPMGQWPRAFKKALKNLSKLGVPSEVVEKTREQFHFLFVMTFEQFARRYGDVFTLLNMDPTNFEYIKSDNIDEADRTAEEYIQNQENPEQIIHTFDDGSYWYDLQATNCPIEAERMGHCGDAGYGNSTLLSLRKKDSKKKESKSYVTVEYNEDESTIYQIKGRGNSAPPEETWPHIAWLVDNSGTATVEENGEHSNDDFSGLQQYLGSETNANVRDSFEERREKMQEELDTIIRGHEGDEEGASYNLWAEVYDEEVGQGEVYYSAGGTITLQINLGWPAMEIGRDKPAAAGHGMARAGEYIPRDLEGNELDDVKRIPTENNWSAANDFLAEAGIKDWGYDLPGEEEAFEYKVEMLVSHDPSWEIGDDEPPRTAHITIEIQTSQETSDDPEAFDYFASELQEKAHEHKTAQQQIRSTMVKEGFAAKNAFDTGRTEIEDLKTQLKNWQIYDEGAEIEFWFNPKVNDEGGRLTVIPSGVEFPVEVFYYTDPSFREPRKTFQYAWPGARVTGGRGGLPGAQVNVSGEAMNRLMARQLSAQYRMSQQSPGQGELDFGADYKRVVTPLELARDLEFIVQPQVHYFRDSQGISDVSISYRLTIRIDPQDNAEEIRKTIAMVQYLNKNPQEVIEAARELIQLGIEPTIEQSETLKKDMLDGSHAKTLINAIDRRYGERAHNGDNEAEKATILARWAEANFDDMTPVEKTALLNTYLYPMSQGALGLYNLELETGPPLDQIGQPVGWENDVREEMRYRGAAQTIRNNYKWKGQGANIAQDPETNDEPEVAALRGTIGEPVDLSEGLPPWIKTPEQYEEEQLERIEKLLEKKRDPDHDLRIYRVRVGCTLVDRVGGTDAEIGAEIRGIHGVTTVRPIADSKRPVTPTQNYIVFEIKFELLGAQSRIDYRDQVLLPRMRRINGLKIVDWTAIHKTNVQGTIRTVREQVKRLEESGFGSAFGMSVGGSAGALSSIRFPGSPARPTPTPTLDSIVQDWVEGGVQVYDFPTDANNMQYHTMLPVSELWHYASRVQRQPKDIFDIKHQRFNASYERLKDTLQDPVAYTDFIKNSAQGPVYVAIGKNGRIRITGNEDLVWFAKKSGLEEVPVFLSYQRQV